MPNIDIIIRTIDKSQGGMTGLSSNLKGLIAQYVSLGAAAGAASKFIVDSIKTTQDYARTVRDLAQVSGVGAEQSSRLLQVLDDFQLTAGDVTAATRFMTKQGLVPTIDTLAKLSDEYLSINDAQARNEFILKNLGRSGLQWVNVLNQGSTALRQMSSDVNEHLILTDEEIQKTEEFRLSVDQLSDSWEGFKVAIGGGLVKDLNDMFWQFDHIREIATEMTRLRKEGAGGFALGFADVQQLQVMAEANIKQRELQTEMVKTYEATTAARESFRVFNAELEQTPEQIEAISQKNEMFLGVLGDVGNALSTYKKGVQEADAALAAGQMTTEEHAAAIDQLSADYRRASNEIVLSIVAMKLATDGWTDAEIKAYLNVAQKMGVVTGEQKALAESALAAADAELALIDPMNHVAGRAEDAAMKLLQNKEAALALADALRKNTNPTVAELKRLLSGLPASGTAWAYYFDITVSGRVPNLSATGMSNPYANIAGAGTTYQGPAIAMAGGGVLQQNQIAIVGDAPGGMLTPYTEAIINGRVFDARTTRALAAAGILDGARSLAGGMVPDVDIRPYIAAPAPIARRSGTGSRVGNSSPNTPGDLAPVADGGMVTETVALVSEVAAQAVSTSNAAVAATDAVTSNIQQGTFQTVATQQQTSGEVVGALNDVLRQLKKQPTKDDMYSLFHAGQQLSI
jgi:hypothetical protein